MAFRMAIRGLEVTGSGLLEAGLGLPETGLGILESGSSLPEANSGLTEAINERLDGICCTYVCTYRFPLCTTKPKKNSERPVAQRQETVIGTLAMLWYFLMVASEGDKFL